MDEPENLLDAAPPSGPARLDHFMRKRIAQMRISPREVARRGGPNRTTLHKAINGTGRLRQSTLSRIDTALGWAPGSAAAIIAGGLPDTRMGADPDNDHSITVMNAALAILGDANDLLVEARSLLTELVTDGQPATASPTPTGGA